MQIFESPHERYTYIYFGTNSLPQKKRYFSNAKYLVTQTESSLSYDCFKDWIIVCVLEPNARHNYKILQIKVDIQISLEPLNLGER